ncbi:alpha/beta hydrolase [Microbulbifer sp. 2205BS26-8]|uniref:alpha/beta hydrolase n=1 Tax=Microbulbifer sp. 2205BS26-8 TaxID=3064386 RepID=UPI00273D2F0E|nr:alpha/beta hydrolase [Microbulbifer sp. 2205BS26-8]MDP5208378.1 alpha/beta hydrolase [Microbulbifer sp. 2205BS26-8]
MAWADSEVAESRDCYLDGWRNTLRCSRLTVGKGDTRVSLAVMVAPAVSESDKAPLYLLAGGPGQAASDLAPMLNLFRRVNRERAIVLVDRRGAGLSQSLDCGWKLMLPTDLEVFSSELADCYLEQKSFANSLSSRQTVNDLERVRKHLGHRKIALWGVSWGTRTALLYQQWYPESLSVLVLDAVAPIETKVFLTAQAAEGALQALERDCLKDRACAQLGDWRTELNDLLENWQATAIPFPDPFTGVLSEEPVPRWVLQNVIRGALYHPETAALLPYAIKQASRGNYLPLSAIEGLLRQNIMSLGLTFSVACAEELNRISPEEVARDEAGTFLGNAFLEMFERGCQVWPVSEKPYTKPELRSHPVLLISGEADPITPPRYVDEQLQYLSNKQHLIIAGGGHSNTGRGCIPELIADFLHAPDKPLEQGCMEEIHRPPFMVDGFGPAPGRKTPLVEGENNLGGEHL